MGRKPALEEMMTEKEWKKEEIEIWEAEETERRRESFGRALKFTMELCEMPMEEREKKMKDVFDKLDADVLCLDLQNMNSRQKEALRRLINDIRTLSVIGLTGLEAL